MRNRERILLDEVNEKIREATDIVASILEGRDDDDDEGGVNFDLRMLYGGLIGMGDDIEDIIDEI